MIKKVIFLIFIGIFNLFAISLAEDLDTSSERLGEPIRKTVETNNSDTQDILDANTLLIGTWNWTASTALSTTPSRYGREYDNSLKKSLVDVYKESKPQWVFNENGTANLQFHGISSNYCVNYTIEKETIEGAEVQFIQCDEGKYRVRITKLDSNTLWVYDNMKTADGNGNQELYTLVEHKYTKVK